MNAADQTQWAVKMLASVAEVTGRTVIWLPADQEIHDEWGVRWHAVAEQAEWDDWGFRDEAQARTELADSKGAGTLLRKRTIALPAEEMPS